MKYRKKPVVIDAIQYNGPEDNTKLAEFCGHWVSISSTGVYITTPEGAMHISKGDYVIRGIKGECYPCKPDIFEASYDPA